MRRKLGEVFEFIGYRLRVEESKKNDCEGCFFYEHQIDCIHTEIYFLTSKCINVIFKQIKEDMKVLLLLSCSLLILSSCRNNTAIKGRYGEQYWIDTLTIHGNPHEVIVSDYCRQFNGFIHSPECWCLTKKDRQND